LIEVVVLVWILLYILPPTGNRRIYTLKAERMRDTQQLSRNLQVEEMHGITKLKVVSIAINSYVLRSSAMIKHSDATTITIIFLNLQIKKPFSLRPTNQ